MQFFPRAETSICSHDKSNFLLTRHPYGTEGCPALKLAFLLTCMVSCYVFPEGSVTHGRFGWKYKIRFSEFFHCLDCKTPGSLMVRSQLWFRCNAWVQFRSWDHGFKKNKAWEKQKVTCESMFESSSSFMHSHIIIISPLCPATHTVSGQFHSMPSTSCVCVASGQGSVWHWVNIRTQAHTLLLINKLSALDMTAQLQ